MKKILFKTLDYATGMALGSLFLLLILTIVVVTSPAWISLMAIFKMIEIVDNLNLKPKRIL